MDFELRGVHFLLNIATASLVYQKQGNQIKVWVAVKYLEQQTKGKQILQYELTLKKQNNWLIAK
ncbi:conjugal transfer protein [Clostridium sp. CF012]|nr:conjugal transfer protein [Clostridium sp. CF012]